MLSMLATFIAIFLLRFHRLLLSTLIVSRNIIHLIAIAAIP